MTSITDIEALGIKVPKTTHYEDCSAHGGSPDTEPVFQAADAAITELLDIIMRMAWERGCAIGWLQSLGKHEVEEALSYAWDTSGRRTRAEEES